MRLYNIYGKSVTKNVTKYLIDWDGKSRSKLQFNVKQFFKDRVHHKPNFISMLNEMNNSNFKYYFVQINDPIINIDDVEKAYSNYFIKLSNENNLGINLIKIKKLEEININKVWFICFAHLSNNDCLEDRRPFDYKILKTKQKEITEKNETIQELEKQNIQLLVGVMSSKM